MKPSHPHTLAQCARRCSAQSEAGAGFCRRALADVLALHKTRKRGVRRALQNVRHFFFFILVPSGGQNRTDGVTRLREKRAKSRRESIVAAAG
jgi:hypothetical protein